MSDFGAPNRPSAAIQTARWGALVAGIWYGNKKLNELTAQRPAEVAASKAALAKQMAEEAAIKAAADAEFANDSILYGTDPASRRAAIVKKVMAIKESNPGNIAIASFDEADFNGMSEADQGRLLKIMASGIGNPGSEMGCYAMGPTDYDDFYAFFKKALGRYHKVNLDEKKHSNDWELKGKEGLPADGVLDVSAFGISEPLSMRIRTARNLKKFPLAGAMSEEDRKNMELAMGPVFEALIANPEFGGSYNSLTPGHPNKISDEKYQELVKAHIMFKDILLTLSWLMPVSPPTGHTVEVATSPKTKVSSSGSVKKITSESWPWPNPSRSTPSLTDSRLPSIKSRT